MKQPKEKWNKTSSTNTSRNSIAPVKFTDFEIKRKNKNNICVCVCVCVNKYMNKIYDRMEEK